MSPLLTVITPTLDVEDTVAATLRSIAATAQPPEVEHIVVDGGSKDRTIAIVKDMAPQAQIVEQTGRGISQALNLALQRARGRFVAALNGDDAWCPAGMRRALDVAASSASDSLIYGNADLLDPRTGVRWRRAATHHHLDRYMSLYHPAMLVPLALHQRLGHYDEDYALAMDCEFVHRALAAGTDFVHVPERIATMRLGGRSHEQNAAAMREFERSVVRHGLRRPLSARYFRIRQTAFHELHRYRWFQRVWASLRAPARSAAADTRYPEP
ncbi:MAG: glycosyltransferase [Pseudomonadota bacterium]